MEKQSPVKIVSFDRNTFTLEQVLPIQEKVSVSWWNPNHRCITNIRHLTVRTTASKQELEDWLKANEGKLRIYSVLSHTPRLSAVDLKRIEQGDITGDFIISKRLRITDEDGDWYIDEFGQYVYIRFEIGEHADVDERYGETVVDTELFRLNTTA